LGITSVDPIKYNLLFFRFIDESRDDWPDIDTDFEKSRRGEIKEYLRRKYGYVASISNFIYFKDKGVIRDAARVYAVPMDEVNRALKQVDTWADYLTTSAKDCVEFRVKYPEVTELASQLRGRIRNVGLHAAGIVTSSVPIEDYAPFETRSDPSDKISGRIPAIAWDMDQCADVGLIKLDVLGLTTLDVIRDTINFVRDRHGKSVDLNSLPLDDKRVFSNLTQGNTVGVFQADAAPYTSLLQEMGVDTFEDLVASNALVRPGARNTVGADFIRRKKGLESVTYVHDMMKPILESTYGTIVYQEQVMQTATMLGGLSNSEANKLRKIIGKKRDASEFDAYRDKFVSGASQYITEDAARDLWHDFEAHADYSFNRSHAVAYSLLSYWTMWLKIYYPIEFMASLFRNEVDQEKKTSIFIEMRRLGIKVKTPHVNESDAEAKIVGDYIRLGLGDIKYISDKVFARIDKARPYSSFAEFRGHAAKKGSGVSSQAIQSLNAVGALEFKDNKRVGDEPNNYYEYLKIPRFSGKPLPPTVLEVITNVDEYNEEGTYIVKGMVKSFKRGKSAAGKEWVRVEIVDETGNIGAFCDPGNTPVAGQMYIMLITWNRIMKYIPVDDFDENNPEHFVKFMHGKGSKPKVGELEVLAVERRFTAKRQLMATIVVANSQREMRRLFIFPSTYATNAGKIKEGKILRAKLGKSQDGTMFIKEIEK
jgi:DNA polymerase-3 subunit alpha